MPNIYNSEEDEELVRKKLRENPLYLKVITLTEERCLIAIEADVEAIKYIPSEMHTEKIALAVAKKDKAYLKYVSNNFASNKLKISGQKNEIVNPSKFQNVEKKVFVWDSDATNSDNSKETPVTTRKKNKTREDYLELIRKNSITLKDVPDGIVDREICLAAVETQGFWLRWVPERYIDKEIVQKALSQNIDSIRLAPGNFLTLELCQKALENNVDNFKYFPAKYLTRDMCDFAVREDWKNFKYIPDKYKTLDNCLKFFTYLSNRVFSFSNSLQIGFYDLFRIIDTLPESIKYNDDVQTLFRKLGVIKCVENGYNAEKKRFIISEKNLYTNKECFRKFRKFKKYYKFLGGDLSGANLRAYDFKRIDLKKYNISGAFIKCDILVSNGLYDSTSYDQSTRFAAEDEEDCVPSLITREEDLETTTHKKSLRFYYISDIHINHQIKKKFPEKATREEIEDFIKSKVHEMVSSVDEASEAYLLVAGDVSFSFENSKVFYTELCKCWEYGEIIAILGNHELWDYGECEERYKKDVKNVVDKYNKLFASLGINFLYNEIIALIEHELVRVKLEDLNQESLSEIRRKMSFAIVGGVGYSGYCDAFNAECGLYRHTVETQEEDIAHTKEFENVYTQALSCFSKDKVIVLTHTPIDNWTHQAYNPNWIYVNGHTHKNDYECSAQRTYYSDNQIGYKYQKLSLKSFAIVQDMDIFRDYEDGVYEISHDEYLDFYRWKSGYIQFKDRDGQIVMLKNKGYYCFLYRRSGRKRYNILSGGRITAGLYDIDEAYKKMPSYVEAIEKIFGKYHKYIQIVSNAVKKFGGDGRIHGSIVDIDYFNHLYINPATGEIAPYFAYSVKSKFFYSDIGTMLKAHNPALYGCYVKAIKSGEFETSLIRYSGSLSSEYRFDADTSMYKDSRKILNVQYLLEDKIIKGFKNEYIDAYINNISMQQVEKREIKLLE